MFCSLFSDGVKLSNITVIYYNTTVVTLLCRPVKEEMTDRKVGSIEHGTKLGQVLIKLINLLFIGLKRSTSLHSALARA
jgi:hypothetical protein